MKKRLLIWLPLLAACILLGVFYRKLTNPAPTAIASQMVSKPMPPFVAAAAFPETPGITSASYKDGQPRLLNVFASWCGPCIVEMPQLLQMKAKGVRIDGLAIHDTPENIAKFLAKNGNPFGRIGLDPQSRVQIELGSGGVPESFVINGKGMIIHQHIGVITAHDVPGLLAMIEKAK